MVLVIGHHQLHAVHVTQRVRVLSELVQVGAELTAPEHPYRAGELPGVVTGVLEGLPRGFQEEAMLGVRQGGVARRVAEELRIEAVHVAEERGRVDVAGQTHHVVGDSGGPHVIRAEPSDRFPAFGQVLPKVVQVICARKAAPHPHDGDRLVSGGHSVSISPVAPPGDWRAAVTSRSSGNSRRRRVSLATRKSASYRVPG